MLSYKGDTTVWHMRFDLRHPCFPAFSNLTFYLARTGSA